MLTFGNADFSCNPLESGVAIAHLDAGFVGNLLDNFCCDNGLDDEISRLEQSLSLAVGDDIIKEEQASLVTVDEHPFALVVFTGHTHAVGIWIRRHYNVCIQCLCVAYS